MKHNNNQKTIIERYKALNEACSRNPIITLASANSKPHIYQEPTGAKSGFVEKFCKINL